VKLVPPLIGYAYMWEGTSSRVGKNDYVPLGTYQNINLENFGGGPVQYFKKVPYSNFLGRTSKKKHPVGDFFVCFAKFFFLFLILKFICLHLNKLLTK
jgi:hypothetical protein